MALTYQKYDSDICLYYQDQLPQALAEAIISHIWRGCPPPAGTTFELLKAERTKVYKMSFHNECYYLKCYTPQSMSKIIKNFFRPADAVRYFQLSYHLQQTGVAVAQSVLALTKKNGLLRADSILVTKEVPGTDLYSYLLQGAQHDSQQRTEIVKQFAFIWSRLIKLKLVHLDCWLGNFIASPGTRAESVQVSLIDVDNIYPRPLLPQKILWLMNVKRLKYKLGKIQFPIAPAEESLFLRELNKFLHTR